MKKISRGILTCTIIVLALHVTAQDSSDNQNVMKSSKKGYVVTGNLSVLKEERAFNVVVSARIQKMGSKDDPDTVYIARRVKEMNEKKAGKGDQWLKQWNETMMNIQPAFVEGLNKYISKSGIVFGTNNHDADYTFVVNTLNLLEFMGDIFIALEVEIVKTKDPSVKIAIVDLPANYGTLKCKSFKGKTERSYYTAAWFFAKYLKKEIF